MREFVHDDFKLSIPEEWADASVVVAAGPPNDGYSPSITVTREHLEYEVNASQYAARQLESLQEEMAQGGYQVREEGPFTLPGLSAFQRVHAFRVDDLGVEITQLQVYVTKGRQALTLTCTNLSDWFDQTRPTFLAAVKQLRWG